MDSGKTQSYRLRLNGCKVLVQNNLRTSSLAEWCVFLCLRSFLDKQMMHIHHIYCLWIDKKNMTKAFIRSSGFHQRSHGSDFKVIAENLYTKWHCLNKGEFSILNHFHLANIIKFIFDTFENQYQYAEIFLYHVTKSQK